MSYQNSTNEYQNTKYIVDAAGGTPYATIQSAINAANTAGIPATVYIREGVYTENLTLYSGINLEGSENSAVNIIGLHTPPASGNLNFNRIGFSSATHILSSAAAGTTLIKFSRCLFALTSGYVCNLTNWTGSISLKYCTDASTANGLIYNTASAPVTIYNSIIGAGTARVMTVNGTLEVFNCKIWCPVTISGSSAVIIEGGSTFKGTITTSGTTAVKIRNSTISTDTATAISHSSATALLLNNVVIDSTNATCIAGTGSIQFNEATFVNSKTLAGTITEVLTGIVKTGEVFADTITRMGMTGFYSWAAVGPYYDDTTLGTFKLLVGGTGYIKGRLLTWVAQNISGMTSGSTWWIYIDSTGTIGKTNARTDALFVDNIVLFECLYDETSGTKVQYTVKENHNYNFQVGASNYLHDTVGAIIENANNGANIVAGTTGARVSISGNDVLTDHGLDTDITAGTDKTWNKMYTTAAGKWARDGAVSTDFAGRYNNAGTPTTLPANRYGVYTLYVAKDDLNAALPKYFAVLDTTNYTGTASANTAISNGTTANATNELAALELAQLGYIIFRQSTGAIVQFTISKSTLRSTLSTGSTNQASLVITDTTAFNGILSAADTNVQAALDTIDNWGAGTTDHALLIGNGNGVAIGVIAVGATGETLMGSTGADCGWTNSPSFGGSVTAGTSLTASNGNVVVTSGNLTLPTTTSTVGQIIMGGVPFITAAEPSPGNPNIFIGKYCGNLTNSSGLNIAIGQYALENLGASGGQNFALGPYILRQLTTGAYNCSIGSGSPAITNGSYNLTIGTYLGSGHSYNAVNYNGADSSNICIQNNGVTGESNALRIGTSGSGDGQINKAYIAGIYGVTPGGTKNIAIIDSNGQLGSAATLDPSMAPTKISINPQTDSYALLLADAGKLVTMTKASANTLTVPKNATVAFATGTQILIAQGGAGKTTIAPEDGTVTINSSGGLLSLYGQYSGCCLTKTDTNVWLLVGDLA